MRTMQISNATKSDILTFFRAHTTIVFCEEVKDRVVFHLNKLIMYMYENIYYYCGADKCQCRQSSEVEEQFIMSDVASLSGSFGRYTPHYHFVPPTFFLSKNYHFLILVLLDSNCQVNETN